LVLFFKKEHFFLRTQCTVQNAQALDVRARVMAKQEACLLYLENADSVTSKVWIGSPVRSLATWPVRMRRQTEDGRARLVAVFFGLGVLWCAWWLLVPALNGVADNGDFQRVLGKVGMATTVNDMRDGFFFAHVRRDFPIRSLIRFSPVSTAVLFAEIAKLANAIFNHAWFDIRWLSSLYAVPLLAGYLFALRHIARHAAALPAAAASSAAAFILLLNPFFVCFLNSFFEEAGFIALLPLLVFYPLGRRPGRLTRREFFAMSGLIVAVASTKVQNIFWLIALMPLWRAAPHTVAAGRALAGAAVIALAILPFHIERVQMLPNAFNRVFDGVALVQPAALADLGLERFAADAGTGFYAASRATLSDTDTSDIRQNASLPRVLFYLCVHPAVAWRLAAGAAWRILHQPLARVPYLAYSERGGIAGIPGLWNDISTLSVGALTLAALLLGLVRRSIDRVQATAMMALGGLYFVATATVVLGEGFNEFGRHMMCANVCLVCASVIACSAACGRGKKGGAQEVG
jgi:hypothetical protein